MCRNLVELDGAGAPRGEREDLAMVESSFRNSKRKKTTLT